MSLLVADGGERDCSADRHYTANGGGGKGPRRSMTTDHFGHRAAGFSIALACGVSVLRERQVLGAAGDGIHWLVGYWDELTSDQQQAAIAMIPELADWAPTRRRCFSPGRTGNDVDTQLLKNDVARPAALKPRSPFN